VIGIAAGLAGAFGVARFAGALFFQVSPADPATFAIVGLVLFAVTTIAAWVPGRRASRIDPILALRDSG
jgi:putative ABC transport system permease protein